MYKCMYSTAVFEHRNHVVFYKRQKFIALKSTMQEQNIVNKLAYAMDTEVEFHRVI